jgi:hypothetical protein
MPAGGRASSGHQVTTTAARILLAAISVYYSQVDSNTCDFNASMTASNGFTSP